jgi:hypothetical protein
MDFDDHTAGVASGSGAEEIHLPELNIDDWPPDAAHQSDSDASSIPDSSQPLSGLDTSVFDDRWKAQMEELNELGSGELYASVSSTGFLPDSWASNAERIQFNLQAVGLTDHLLSYQGGDERTILEQLILQAGIEMSAREFLWHERQLGKRINWLAARLPLSKRLKGSAHDFAQQMLDDSSHPSTLSESSPVSTQPAPLLQELANHIPLKGMRKKSPLVDGSAGISRELKDAGEKVFWTGQVVRLLRLVNAPLVELAAGSTRPDDIFEIAVGAARGSTMKTYMQALTPFRNYLMMLTDSDWTSEVVHVVGFLRTAASKPCGPTYPKRFVQALRWVMRIGGWTGPELIAEHVLVQKSMDYWSEALFSQVHPLKQAPKLPWVVIAALELYICNDRHPKHLRYKAYTIMFKAIGTLREDDIQHLKARKLRAMGYMFIGDLMKSKTTGAAKRVRQLPVAIHMQWTLTRSLWIENGIALTDDLVSEDADYMLPRFDLAGKALREPCPYSESAALSKKLLGELRAPVFQADKWILAGRGGPSAEPAAFRVLDGALCTSCDSYCSSDIGSY